jgi:two-component system, chemotaxis family, chemotaxis protein CheY
MRLLIVEDSPLVRRMYGLAFYRRDHDLVEAQDGLEALDILAASTRRFDLILLDLRMPGLDGVGFIQAVRRNPRFNVPIIVTTSEPESSPLLQEARALGVAAIMKKPWKPHELAELVQSVLETWHP